MAKINENELTKEQIEKAMACETAEELMALAKAEGGTPPGITLICKKRDFLECGGRYAPRNNAR